MLERLKTNLFSFIHKQIQPSSPFSQSSSYTFVLVRKSLQILPFFHRPLSETFGLNAAFMNIIVSLLTKKIGR
jgi:hypothetical protein